MLVHLEVVRGNSVIVGGNCKKKKKIFNMSNLQHFIVTRSYLL